MIYGLQTRLLAYGLAVALIVAVVCGLYFAGRSAGIKHDAKRSAPIIASLKLDVASCHANVDTLTLTLERQNAAVEAIAAESAERTRRAEAAIRTAQEQARGLKTQIARLERAKPSGEVCEAARELIVDTLSEDRR